MPKFSRSSWRLRSTVPSSPRCTSASSCSLLCTGSGTIKRTTSIDNTVSTPVSTKMPGTPIQWLNSGAKTRLTEKVTPMLKPIMAMARVRTSSRVKSASSAVTAALTAPAPCTARANTSISKLVAMAAIKLPNANTAKPR